MTGSGFMQVLAFSAPLCTALICCVLMAMYHSHGHRKIRRRLTTLMMCTYAAAFFCWLGVILYIASYDGFVWFNTFFFLCLMLDQVFLYHFVFIITGTGGNRRFNPIHYIVPLVLTIAMGVWSLAVPYEVQYYIVESRGENAPGYLWYSMFFSATVPIFILYNIFYPLAGLRRVRAYRREVVNYSADDYPASAGWLYRLIFLIWLSLPLASGVLFVHKSVLFSSSLTVVGAFLPIFQYLIICYNLLSGNYVIIEPSPEEIATARASALDRFRFERYMRESKPYLNPKLRITDVAAGLNTNRSYISSLVNGQYGMNFSRYVNCLRLEELNRLRTSPESAGYTNMELVLMAGFSSYRSYLRVKAEDDKANTIKVFE